MAALSIFCSLYSSLSKDLFRETYTYHRGVRFPLEETACFGLLFNYWD